MVKKILGEKLPPRLTLAEAAEVMKVVPDQVLIWTERGRLRAIQPEGNEPAYLREEVMRMLSDLDAERPGPPNPFPIVGIGASAGGLEAVLELLTAVPPDLGMAYVFISHLSPDHESMLPEILQKRTKMPVHKVENGMFVKPDNVFVIPPNANMSIVDGVLTLQEPRTRTEKGFHPINAFLMQLAEVYQMNAVGVVLSGTATDGTIGLKAVRAGGGWTFAQDDSAKFKDMPHNAQEAGVVDFVLAPAAIAKQLADLRKHPVAELAIMPKPIPDDARALHEILVLMHRKRGVDFSQYKSSTINRRILRRMLLHRLKDLGAYARMLNSDTAERDLLFEDLLINVTTFFREPKFFHALKQRILPHVLKDRDKNDPVRIWVAGCSTGEESVSIAIILLEHFGDSLRSIPVQIFSTDLDPKAVEKARQGMYGKVALESISATRLKQYFNKVDGHYQVVKAVRDMCVFAQHDLLKDPPFSRIDLLSCQNVLIYLDTNAQQKVLRGFHYALKQDGFLALGRSETVNTAGDLFGQEDKDYKLFNKRGVRKPIPSDPISRLPEQKAALPSAMLEEIRETAASGEQELDREAERMLLHRHIPASVVVNKDLEIVRFRGATAPYMAPHAGRASLSLLKMVREDLVFELRALLRKVKAERAPLLRSGLEIVANGVVHTVSIEVAPMRVSLEEDHYLIVFLDDNAHSTPTTTPKLKGPAKKDTQDTKDKRIGLLERELRDVREQMRILVEEAEGRTEQLQTANEEVLSSNEELQSMNEELETSKEELQSTNEELTTINDELLQRHEQLKESRDYADSIIGSLNSPLVILNANMRVRSANEAFYRTFHTIKEETEGTLIHELGNNQWDVATLRKHLFEVLAKGTQMHDFEVSHTYPDIGDRTILLSAKRIDHHGVQERILITMEDITERRKVENDLLRLAAIVTSTDDAILSMDLNGKVLTWNAGAERLYGYSATEMIGHGLDRLIPAELSHEAAGLLHRIAKGERIDHFETRRIHKDGHVVDVSLAISPLRATDGKIVGLSKTAHDITEKKRIQASFKESEARFHLLADNMDQLAWISNPDGSNTWFNDRWLEFTGMSADDLRARSKEIHHPEYYGSVVESLRSSIAKGENWESIFPLKGKDGKYRWFLSRAMPLRSASGAIQQWFGTSTDITDRMKAEEALKEADRRKDEFLATLAHELRNPLAPLRNGVELLKDLQDPEVVETRSIMERQVNHMVRLVDDLLDLGRISSGKLMLRMRRMDLREAVDTAIEAARPLMKAKAQHFTDSRPNRHLIVNADAARLTQVISNLLNNAAKFTAEGGEIELAVQRSKDSAEIIVKDNGIGLPPEMLEHVFDMFAQVDPAERAKAGGGLGIGLHIVRRIATMHGGDIQVHSKGKGMGSTFIVRIPLLEGGPAEKPTVETDTDTTQKAERVLIVDDNNDAAVMLSMVCRGLGCETRVANDCTEGLRLGENFRPTLVFTDIGMPGVDGYETCARMRRTAWGAHIRILALSGWGQDGDKVRSAEAGFDEHLIKPIDHATLSKVLHDAKPTI